MINEQELTSHDVPIIDLTTVKFSDVEYFGHDHATHTAKLSGVILSHASRADDTQISQKILWIASLLHDTQRETNWQANDVNAPMRSAIYAEKFLKTTEHWADKFLVGEVCKLIVGIDNSDLLRTNPLAQSLHDADLFEVCRFETGSPIGLRELKKRAHRDALKTQWAKEPANLRAYMRFRGW